MKKMFKIFGVIALIAVIGFALVGCDNGNNGGGTGSLTITGLDGYNTEYIFATSDELIAAVEINERQNTFTPGNISGGKVSLKVWENNNDGLDSYNGDDLGIEFDVIKTTSTGENRNHIGITIVNFSNGVGKGTFVADEE
jgi:uncharacterized lipoprotein NlpE involved in copper resistance